LDVLETYESNQCKLDIIHYGVGNVCVTDIEYADAFKGKLNYSIYFTIYTLNFQLFKLVINRAWKLMTLKTLKIT